MKTRVRSILTCACCKGLVKTLASPKWRSKAWGFIAVLAMALVMLELGHIVVVGSTLIFNRTPKNETNETNLMTECGRTVCNSSYQFCLTKSEECRNCSDLCEKNDDAVCLELCSEYYNSDIRNSTHPANTSTEGSHYENDNDTNTKRICTRIIFWLYKRFTNLWEFVVIVWSGQVFLIFVIGTWYSHLLSRVMIAAYPFVNPDILADNNIYLRLLLRFLRITGQLRIPTNRSMRRGHVNLIIRGSVKSVKFSRLRSRCRANDTQHRPSPDIILDVTGANRAINESEQRVSAEVHQVDREHERRVNPMLKHLMMSQRPEKHGRPLNQTLFTEETPLKRSLLPDETPLKQPLHTVETLEHPLLPEETPLKQSLLPEKTPPKRPLPPDETPLDQPLLTEEPTLQKPLLPKETSMKQPLLTEGTPLEHSPLPEKTPQKLPLLPEESPLKQPLLREETPLKLTLLTEETPLEQPLLPKETSLKQPLLTEGTPLEHPRLPEETPAKQPLLPEETPVKQPLLPEETPVKQPLLPEETPVKQPLLPEQTAVAGQGKKIYSTKIDSSCIKFTK